MKKQIACPVCDGSGHVAWINKTEDTCSTGSKICPHCDGTGLREVDMTNGDRFRAMSDTEIAVWAEKQIGCGYEFFPCGLVCDGNCNTYNAEDCRAKIIEFLQQPAKEG